MTTALIGLLAVLALTVLVMLLEPVTRRAANRALAWDAMASAKAQSTKASEPVTPAVQDVADTRETPPSSEDTVGPYFRRVVSQQGLIGAFLIPVMLAFFPANALIFADGMQVLLDREGIVLTTVTMGPWSWNLTDLQLYGGIVALAMVLLGAAFSTLHRERSRAAWVLFATALAPLLCLDVGLSALRGTLIAQGSAVSPAVLGAASGLQGLVCAQAELWAGHFAVCCFLVPLAQLCAALATAPFRCLAGLARRVRLPQVKSANPTTDPDRPGIFVRLLANLDEGVMTPLRNIDAQSRTWFVRWRSQQAPDSSRVSEIEEVSNGR